MGKMNLKVVLQVQKEESKYLQLKWQCIACRMIEKDSTLAEGLGFLFIGINIETLKRGHA